MSAIDGVAVLDAHGTGSVVTDDLAQWQATGVRPSSLSLRAGLRDAWALLHAVGSVDVASVDALCSLETAIVDELATRSASAMEAFAA